jgi:hypothetical protein
MGNIEKIKPYPFDYYGVSLGELDDIFDATVPVVLEYIERYTHVYPDEYNWRYNSDWHQYESMDKKAEYGRVYIYFEDTTSHYEFAVSMQLKKIDGVLDSVIFNNTRYKYAGEDLYRFIANIIDEHLESISWRAYETLELLVREAFSVISGGDRLSERTFIARYTDDDEDFGYTYYVDQDEYAIEDFLEEFFKSPTLATIIYYTQASTFLSDLAESLDVWSLESVYAGLYKLFGILRNDINYVLEDYEKIMNRMHEIFPYADMEFVILENEGRLLNGAKEFIDDFLNSKAFSHALTQQLSDEDLEELM